VPPELRPAVRLAFGNTGNDESRLLILITPIDIHLAARTYKNAAVCKGKYKLSFQKTGMHNDFWASDLKL
jgi:hypothetical protein